MLVSDALDLLLKVRKQSKNLVPQFSLEPLGPHSFDLVNFLLELLESLVEGFLNFQSQPGEWLYGLLRPTEGRVGQTYLTKQLRASFLHIC